MIQRTIRLGDRGSDVAFLQRSLAAVLKQPLAADSVFGPKTAHAVRAFQTAQSLAVDGVVGPATWAALDKLASPVTGFPRDRVWPLRALADGRRPRITSEYWTRNPSRSKGAARHLGVDLFFPYRAGDPPMKVGDGGRTGSGWWIPNGTVAIACCAGMIELAGPSKTGVRVWLRAPSGHALGYFHLASALVHVGQSVRPGDPIGLVGDNPRDKDARHLHFELYVGDLNGYSAGSLDPEPFLLAAPVLAAA